MSNSSGRAKPYQALVAERVHRLEPASRHIREYGALHDWWLASSLAQVLDLPSLPRALGDTGLEQLRAAAWDSIAVSARKVVEVEAALRPLLRRFEGYRHLEPKLNSWCRSFVVVLWGSTSRFEAELASDLDLMVVADTDNLDHCREALQGLIIWPLKLALLDKRVQRKFDGQRLRVDKFVAWIDRRALSDNLSGSDGFLHLTFLLGWGHPLHNARELARYLAPCRALPREAFISSLHASIEDKLERALASVRDDNRNQRDFSHYSFLFVRMCLISLAVRYLETNTWILNYFTLAEKLREAGVLDGEDWRTVQEGVVWALHVRSSWASSELDRRQLRLVLESLEGLNDVTQRLVLDPAGASARAQRKPARNRHAASQRRLVS